MNVVAVIVTYNRKELLATCLRAVANQTRKPDGILVVDNASSDGTREMLRHEFPDVELLTLPTNTGGAGGFSAGINLLLEKKSADFAWLMDDDAEPKATALAPLVSAMETDSGAAPGFVASRVETPEGTQTAAYKYPSPHSSIPNYWMSPPGTRPVGYAIFVGILVNLKVASRTFLPVSDFFIWWDDTEYTARLQRMAGGFECPASVIVHPAKPELNDLKERLYYDIRNRLWVLFDRRLGSASSRKRSSQTFWRRIRYQARHSEDKKAFGLYLTRGLLRGMLTRPRLAYASKESAR